MVASSESGGVRSEKKPSLGLNNRHLRDCMLSLSKTLAAFLLVSVPSKLSTKCQLMLTLAVKDHQPLSFESLMKHIETSPEADTYAREERRDARDDRRFEDRRDARDGREERRDDRRDDRRERREDRFYDYEGRRIEGTSGRDERDDRSQVLSSQM